MRRRHFIAMNFHSKTFLKWFLSYSAYMTSDALYNFQLKSTLDLGAGGFAHATPKPTLGT